MAPPPNQDSRSSRRRSTSVIAAVAALSVAAAPSLGVATPVQDVASDDAFILGVAPDDDGPATPEAIPAPAPEPSPGEEIPGEAAPEPVPDGGSPAPAAPSPSPLPEPATLPVESTPELIPGGGLVPHDQGAESVAAAPPESSVVVAGRPSVEMTQVDRPAHTTPAALLPAGLEASTIEAPISGPTPLAEEHDEDCEDEPEPPVVDPSVVDPPVVAPPVVAPPVVDPPVVDPPVDPPPVDPGDPLDPANPPGLPTDSGDIDLSGLGDGDTPTGIAVVPVAAPPSIAAAPEVPAAPLAPAAVQVVLEPADDVLAGIVATPADALPTPLPGIGDAPPDPIAVPSAPGTGAAPTSPASFVSASPARARSGAPRASGARAAGLRQVRAAVAGINSAARTTAVGAAKASRSPWLPVGLLALAVIYLLGQRAMDRGSKLSYAGRLGEPDDELIEL